MSGTTISTISPILSTFTSLPCAASWTTGIRRSCCIPCAESATGSAPARYSAFIRGAMFRSLRWRLTGWYVLILAGVLLLFSAGIYAAVYKLLLENFDDVLRQQARLVAQMVDLT